MSTCVVAQAGGPTAVINSTLYGVVDEAKRAGISKILGARGGIRGILKEDFVDLGRLDQNTLARIRRTPGAALGGCRYKLPSGPEGSRDFDRIAYVLAKHNVRYFFYVGGNDSMDTALKIHECCASRGLDVSVIGIPKTVDNDICHTDHCPGYGSAAKYIATCVREAGIHAASMYDDEKVVILETVGRNTGWLAASSALAKTREGSAPHLIYLPEVDFSEDRFLADVDRCISRLGGAFVVVAEGIKTKDGRLIGNADPELKDPFGHPQLGEAASYLCGLVRARLKVSARYAKLDICQQSAMHLASRTDWEEAAHVGRQAVSHAVAGGNCVMVSLRRPEGPDPKRDARARGEVRCGVGWVPLSLVANMERRMPDEWIDRSAAFVTPDFLSYLTPLVLGEVPALLESGLPVYADPL